MRLFTADTSPAIHIVLELFSMRHAGLIAGLVYAVLLAATAAQAGQAIDGPPAPISPDVMTRDGAGQVTIRAIKLTSPLKVDGRLDEEVYTRERSFGSFLQVVPHYGEEQ